MAYKLLEGVLSVSSLLTAPISIHNYSLDEQSNTYSQPIELYLFNRDNIDYWAYTSSDSIVNYNGRAYSPVLIKRSEIALDANSLKTRVRIKVDLFNSFVRNFISEAVEGRVSLIIYRSHAGSYVTYWKGTVLIVRFKSKTAEIIVGLKIVSLKRSGLMRKYQRNCGLPLYSVWCGISKEDAAYKVSGTINLVDNTIIDATVFGTKTDGWFVGGIFKTNNGSCLQRIVYHVGNKIKIARSVSALAANDSFVAWAGCDHLKTTCKNKFDNKLNFGGQPYLPDKNPFVGDPVT